MFPLNLPQLIVLKPHNREFVFESVHCRLVRLSLRFPILQLDLFLVQQFLQVSTLLFCLFHPPLEFIDNLTLPLQREMVDLLFSFYFASQCFNHRRKSVLIAVLNRRVMLETRPQKSVSLVNSLLLFVTKLKKHVQGSLYP